MAPTREGFPALATSIDLMPLVWPRRHETAPPAAVATR
jgi:hypothetical protein